MKNINRLKMGLYYGNFWNRVDPRHINKIPVYGGASIFVKIAAEGLVESVGIEWKEINEKPIAEEIM